MRQARRHVLSRLRSDTVFYDLPPERLPGQKGRSRSYGDKHQAKEWAKKEEGWTEHRLRLYDREAVLRLYDREVVLQLKSVVAKQRTLRITMRLVAVRWGKRPVVFLFSSDPQLTAVEIVTAYCARFAIETGFRDAKQNFGLATYQVRRHQSILRLVHLCLWAQTFAFGHKHCCACVSGSSVRFRCGAIGASRWRT